MAVDRFRCGWQSAVACALLLMIATRLGSAAAAEGVTFEPGNLPIILTAPHGGREAIQGVPERRGGGVESFRSVRDVRTDRLTEQLAEALKRKLGHRPYVVIARFHRKYLDANRPRQHALESERAEATYDAYHEAIASARDQVIRRWGCGILLDIHGQGHAAEVVYRGTQNGKTTTHLLNRFGREAMVGSRSLFGQLAKQGLEVFPKVGSAAPEHPPYAGGYTVRTYGSGHGGTLDAIQLELGSSLRSSEALAETAEKLAAAIRDFARDYLPISGEAASAFPQRVLREDFAAGNHHGWRKLNGGSSQLSIQPQTTSSGRPAELLITTSQPAELHSFVLEFPAVELSDVGDRVTLQFDARHHHVGFVNRGFRFGLFDSSQTRIDGDLGPDERSRTWDDHGYFAILDMGRSTTLDSAVIRETRNNSEERLWNGSTLAVAQNGKARDPLIFTGKRSYTYRLTLARTSTGQLDVALWNQVTGRSQALRGTTKDTPTSTFDTIYFGVYGAQTEVAIDNLEITRGNAASEPSNPDPIRVGVYVDEGAGLSFIDLLFALDKFADVHVTRLNADEIRAGELSQVDVLILPGGSGGGQGRFLGERGREAIRRFVRAGGGYIGICAGAYLATADYPWSLHILDARVLDREHWNRGVGRVKLKLSELGQQTLRFDAAELEILYAQGPLLAPGNRADLDDYQELATFRTEVAKNGAPQGVMQGTTAIAKGTFGQGRVVCFSPHPELTPGLERLVQLAIHQVKRTRPSKTERTDRGQ